MPADHAVLSASGAHRWLACPPSARLESGLSEEGASPYAEEGTAAHALAELELRIRTGTIWPDDVEREEEIFRSRYQRYDSPAMREYIAGYVDSVLEALKEAEAEFGEKRTLILMEQRLDFSPWVPEGFGTGDVVLITPGYLTVIDLKYGKGIPVSAEENPQLKLYALGAYHQFGALYDFEQIRTRIDQPRLENRSEYDYSLKELLSWGEQIKPTALQAYEGKGRLKAGEHCRFCKFRTQCRVRAIYMLELADAFQTTPAEQLTAAEMGRILDRSSEISAWLKEISDYALRQALSGVRWPGYKIVEGRSNRTIADEQAAVKAFTEAGIPEALLYERKFLGLSRLEEDFGKKRVSELIGHLVRKPQGKPTLVPDKDKRSEMPLASTAAEDFSNETEE